MPFVKMHKCTALIRILLLGHLTKSIGGYEFLLFDFHAGEGGVFSCFLIFWHLAKNQEGFLNMLFVCPTFCLELTHAVVVKKFGHNSSAREIIKYTDSV